MRIGIDLRFTAAAHMGTGTYAEQAASALAAAVTADDVLVGFSPARALPTTLAARIQHERVPQFAAGGDGELVDRVLWDAAIERSGIDVLFSPNGLAPAFARCPVVVTIHDLLFEHEPTLFAPGLLAHLKRELPRAVAAATAVVAISEHTRHDLLRTYGVPAERVQVITQELPARWTARPADVEITAALRELGVAQPYLLHLSNLAPHKNPQHCLEVFARWLSASGDRRQRLVIAGGGPAPAAPADLQALATRLGIADRVQVLGRIADRHLPALYAGATLLLIPSRFEGWGLPPLEAMAMGTPAIVSDRGGLPEAVGSGAVILPLDDLGRWIEAVDRLAGAGPSPALRAAMTARVRALRAPRGAELLQVLRAAAAAPPTRPASRSPAVTVPQPRTIQLTGCMIIKNGVKLGYPFVEAITAVIDHVDEMVVVDGDSADGTWEVLTDMAATCPKLRLQRQAWPTTVTGGRVIAEATNHALGCCRGRGSHILYVQADEIFTDAALVRLRELLAAGYDSAAMPFLHFRSGWDRVIANPAYVATIRCVPNRPGVASVGDATSFEGPLAPCAMPDEFPEPIFHVGWVYTDNIIAKHQNHAAIYADHRDYQRKAAAATSLAGQQSRDADTALIDPEYELLWYRGQHPPVIRHLLALERYEAKQGLEHWRRRWLVGHPAAGAM